jgi:DNA-binding CsgD family transcriptional regulator
MTLTLTSHDQARIRRAQDALLSPLDYETVDAWRADVNDRIKRVVGADKAVFMLPATDSPRAYSEEFDLSKLTEYPEQLRPLDLQYSIWENVVRLGVANRAMFWGKLPDDYYQSAYYNEYVVPMRGFHGVSMGVALDRADGSHGDVFNEETVSKIVVHHDTPTRTPFGERGIGMLRLLYPAFLAGVRTLQHMQSRRSLLFESCDASDTAILVIDRTGGRLHQTPTLTTLLEADPESESIKQAMERVAHGFKFMSHGSDALVESPAVISKTPVNTYRIYGIRPTPDLVQVGAAALILIKPARTPVASADELQERFQLTRRQAEVAQLLAQRKTNPEIAHALCISPHTARHHTEAVLSKLGISSRREVRARIHL